MAEKDKDGKSAEEETSEEEQNEEEEEEEPDKSKSKSEESSEEEEDDDLEEALAKTKKALAKERRLRKKAEQKNKGETKEDDQKAVEEATQKANQRILKAEIRAAAAKKLHNPEDAVALLDLDEFEVGDDGEIDEDEIASAIDTLVKERPYLAVDSKPSKRRSGNDLGKGDKGKDKPDMNDLLRVAAKGG